MYQYNIIKSKQTNQQKAQQIHQKQTKKSEIDETTHVDVCIGKVIQYLRIQQISKAQTLLQEIRNRSLQKIDLEKYVSIALKQPEELKMLVDWSVNNLKDRKKHTIIMIGLLLVNINEEKVFSKYLHMKNIKKKLIQQKNNKQAKDVSLLLYNSFKSTSKSSLINYYKVIGQILANIDVKLAIRCYKLYFLTCRNDQSKFLLGKALVDTKDIEEGLNYLNQINYEKYDLSGLILMGKCYYHLRYFKQSLMIYLQIIALDKDLTYFSTISHFQIGNIFEDMIFHKKSINHYIQSFQINKKRNAQEQSIYWESLIRIARIYSYNNDHFTSNQILSRVIDLQGIPQKKQAVAYSMLGHNLKSLGNYHKSLYYFKKIERIEATYENLENIGSVYLCLQDYASAQTYFNRILELNSQNAKILTYMAYIKAKQNNFPKCKYILQQAQGYSKLQVVTHEYYQKIIEQIHGNNDTSIQIMNNIKQYFQEMSQNLYQTGSALKSNFKNNISLVYLSQAYKLNPKNLQILFKISIIFLQCGRFDDCIYYLKQGLKIEYNNQNFLHLICRVYHYLNKKQQEKIYLQQLTEVNNQKAQSISRLTYFNNGFYLQGIQMTFFPSKIQQNHLDIYFQGLYQFINCNKEQSIAKFLQLFNLVCDNSFELLDFAYSIAKSNIFPIAYKFYTQYFSLKPFDKKAWVDYLSIISDKKNVTHIDVYQLQKTRPSNIKEGRPFFMMAKLYQRIGKKSRVLDYAIEAIKYQHIQQHYNYLFSMYSSIKYKHEQSWRRIMKTRPDYWKTHEEIAYSLQNQEQKKEEFIYHLEKVLQYSFKWQWSLTKLCAIYKRTNLQKYLEYANKLAIIQKDNFYLFYEMGQVYGQKCLQKEQIQAYNKVILLNPMYKPAYSALQKIYHRKYNGNSSNCGNINTEMCYSLQMLINPQLLSNSLVLSFWYSHYDKLQESFSCFMLWVQQIKNIKVKQQRNKRLNNSMAWISNFAHNVDDKDVELKLFILQKLRGNKKRAFTYFSSLIFESYCENPKDKIKRCLRFINYFQNTLLRYSTHQISCVFQLFLQEIQNICPKKALKIQNNVLTRYPSIILHPQNNPLEYSQQLKIFS